MGNASFQNFEVAHQIVNDAKVYLVGRIGDDDCVKVKTVMKDNFYH